MRGFYLSSHFTPYVILFLERDGSTYLSSLLSSHPEVEAVYERFAVLNQKEAGAAEQISWARSFWTPAWINRVKARGFKTKLVDVLDVPAFQSLMIEKKCHIIYMQRKNRIKAVISKINAKRLYDKSGYWNLYTEKDRVPLTYFDPHEVDALLQEREMLEKELESFVSGLSLPTLKITYEDLMAQRDPTLRKIFEFLHISQKDVESKTLKHTSDNLQDVIENFSELKSHYQNSPYFEMFGEGSH
ncbi:MAG: hypothetical protein CVU39_17850 [Chloroflexi bacterium HGW-Chloroflexi-10]|nr:MAG: hypothetical protein CVU39_17850 [Chloroflexi bacterium HGW-Chloroflexi-10]